jgi:AcrR family transcriptional regulator
VLEKPNVVRHKVAEGTESPDRTSRRREQTRREILDAAWQVARERGLTGLTLRDVADRVGMRAPSLYSHFESKHAIYDAMYGEAWTAYEQEVRPGREALPDDMRATALLMTRAFFDFAVADPVRFQLMNQRVIPGFEPSAESYAPAVRVLEESYAVAAARGVTDPDDVAILLALLSGLIDQQLANDPGGDRFSQLLARAVDMWCDGVGVPRTPSSQEATS